MTEIKDCTLSLEELDTLYNFLEDETPLHEVIFYLLCYCKCDEVEIIKLLSLNGFLKEKIIESLEYDFAIDCGGLKSDSRNN